MSAEYDLSKAVGYEHEPTPVSWNTRDVLLYAVGVGAKATDLPAVFEGHPKFVPFPTYPVVLPFKGDNQGVVDFRSLVSKTPIPGLPKMSPDRMVFGSNYIEILKPIPSEALSGWSLKKKIVGVHENSSGIIIDNEIILVDPNGTPYTKMYASYFNIGAGSQQRFSKVIAGAPVAKPIPTDRAPDYVVTEKTSEEQAVIFRLSGDYNYLHIDPSIGKKAGLGGVILHGLSSLGFATRAIVAGFCGGDLNGITALGNRFASPVKPGDTLETSIWEVGPGPDGTVELAFVQKDIESGKICISHGIAYVKKAEKA